MTDKIDIADRLPQVPEEKLSDKFQGALGGARRMRAGMSGWMGSPVGRWAAAGLVLVLLAAIGALVGWQVTSSRSGGQAGKVPVIRAEPGKARVRPADPGGMDVPYRDVQVYERMRENGRLEQVERLLPEPESPLPPPNKPPAPQVVAKPTAKPVPTPKPAPVKITKAAAPAAVGGHGVQLAALGSRAAAEKEWTRLSGLHAALLGKLRPSIVRVDRGPGKDPIFRLRAMGLGGAEASRAVCAGLAAKKVACIPVRP